MQVSWERLGDEVRSRRAYLGLTQEEVKERGGLSVDTLRKIENRRADALSPRLRRGLERALKWQPESVDEVLAGGSPRLIAEQLVPNAPQTFALAETMLNLKRLAERQIPSMDPADRAAAAADVSTYAKEAEESIIALMPWLGDDERGEAIRILSELRRPIGQ